MSKRDFVPNDDGSVAALLEKLTVGMDIHGLALGFSATEISALTADSTYFRFVLTQQHELRSVSQQWTAWKDSLRDGGDGTPTVVPAFHSPPTTLPTPVAPGVVGRMRAAARRVKASPNYSVAIGKALGIEGIEESTPDYNAAQPELTAELTGDRVRIAWARRAADAVELHVDRGDGKGFVFLAIDSMPYYFDTTPIPTAPTVWRYKAMYRKHDERIGQWSSLVTVALGS